MKLTATFVCGNTLVIHLNDHNMPTVVEGINNHLSLIDRLRDIERSIADAHLYFKIMTTDPERRFITGPVSVELEFTKVSIPTTVAIKCMGTVNAESGKVTLFLYADDVNSKVPSRLHPDTSALLEKTFRNLSAKLYQSQVRMRLTDGWSKLPEGSQHEAGKSFFDSHSMNVSLLNHIAKGDILDSMAYLMFMHELKIDIEARVKAAAYGMMLEMVGKESVASEKECGESEC